jgi:hypothetical protein
MNAVERQLHLAEKARRRRRFETRTGPVHLRGGRRQKTKHTKGHGRGRPQNNDWRKEI